MKFWLIACQEKPFAISWKNPIVLWPAVGPYWRGANPCVRPRAHHGATRFCTLRSRFEREQVHFPAGVFNALDIVATLQTGNYLQGPYVGNEHRADFLFAEIGQ